MVAPYTQATQHNKNKCPHGLPVGACPICAGMGGGVSKNKDKPRRMGEMSYNECMAVWVRMQALKNAKQKARIENNYNIQKEFFERLSKDIEKMVKMLDKIVNDFKNMPFFIKIPLQIGAKIISNIISKIPIIFNVIQNITSNLNKFIQNVSEKMAMVFGEIKNFIDTKITQKISKIFKSILSLFSEKEREDEENEEIEKLKARELKKIIKSLFNKKQKENKEQ